MSDSKAGTHKHDCDTPILCIDVETMEANLESMSSFMRERGKGWRPHQKCHKTPEIARRQVKAGAIGVTCAKVSEAHVMADGGITDILIANMIVGEPKVNRVAELCRKADPIVACDHFAQVEPLAAACSKAGVTCRVITEVDIGLNRVGVRPGRDNLELASAIDSSAGVKLVGIMGYEGHLLTIEDPEEKRRQIHDAMDVLKHCRDSMLQRGLCCDIVSAGGTGSYQITADCEAVTELQAGGGIFADLFYLDRCGISGLSPALTVLATVVSRPSLERAILDAGRKTLMPDIHPPQVKDYPDAKVAQLSAEHCRLELGPLSRDLRIGDKVELIVGYSDFATVLHDQFHVFRNEQLEHVWPIEGRGKLT